MNEAQSADSTSRKLAVPFVLTAAFAFGVICCWAASRRPHEASTDFAQIWHAATALVNGRNPYGAVGPGKSFPLPFPLFYPLPAVIVGVPFTALSVGLASAAFAGLSAALLLFAVLRSERYRLLVILSAPFIYASWLSQWSPILTAAALLPAFGFLFAAKPTIGAALFLYRPSWWAVIGGTVIVALSFAVQPTWVNDWRLALRSSGHMVIPIVHGVGPLVALAILRWRRPESRLLLVMACVPQTALLYEALPLALVPASLAEMSAFVGLSWVAYEWWVRTGLSLTMSGQTLHSVHIIVPLLYLPCVIMVLRRPNEGYVPPWIEQGVVRLQAWGRRASGNRMIIRKD